MRGTENIQCLTQLHFFYKKPVYNKLCTKTSENQEVCGMLKYGVKLFTLCLLLSALNSLPFTCCYGKSKNINNPTNMSIIKCFPKKSWCQTFLSKAFNLISEEHLFHCFSDVLSHINDLEQLFFDLVKSTF